VDATNNLAEREGRPAVIARKLSAGNRTEAGAETHAVLASVLSWKSAHKLP
jgi:transposase